jgi:hypothetical protein
MNKLILTTALIGFCATASLAAGPGGIQGSTTRADVEARMKLLFTRLDANGDGNLTEDEIAKVGQQGTRAKMLARADGNSDGTVSLAELTGAALKRFDRADANKNGIVTPEERQAAHGGKCAREGAQGL